MTPVNRTEVPVEVIDWTPRWGMGALAANFARIQILLTLFDGDPDKWLEVIARSGGPDDDADVPFLAVMKGRLSTDPTLLDDLRRIVNEFAEKFGAYQA